jgi:hypothetical protein
MPKTFSEISWVLIGCIFAVPEMEIIGVSFSYLPCFFALPLILLGNHYLPKVVLLLFTLGTVSLSSEILFPTSPNYLGSRYRSVTNQINTKFANSIMTENFVLWLKFSTALLGGVALVFFAYMRFARRELVNGFLLGSSISVIVSFFTLEPGEGAFFQSVGLGRTSTTFGMICTFSISLLYHHEINSGIRSLLIFLFLSGSLVSGSRGAALTSAVILFFALIWQNQVSRMVWFSWFLLVLAIGFVELGRSLLGDIGLRAFTQNQSTKTSSFIRDQLRNQALLDWQYDPLGGVGFSVLTQGHNTYLQTLAAGGFILFFGYVFIDFRSVYLSARVQKIKGNGYILGLVLTIIFNHMTQNQIDVPFLYLILGIILFESKIQIEKIKIS